MANVFPRARLRLIWIGWKSAARRGKPRQSMNHRAPGAVGISCFLTPSVRAVPYGPNAAVANLSLVVCFCHHEHKPAMNTTDPEIQALLTPTDAQSGFLADAWISCVRLQYFLLQHVLFGLLANPASS